MKSILIATCMAIVAIPVAADINWVWINAGTGTEQGTFVTDGNLVGTDAPAGSYTLLDFSVTASIYGATLGSVSGGQWLIGQPDVGFEWDGSQATQLWRQNGDFTNGFGFWSTEPPPPNVPDYIAFDANWFVVRNYEHTVTFLEEWMAVIMIPHQVPVEGTSFSELKALY